MIHTDRELHADEHRFFKLLETLPLIVYSVEPTPPFTPIYVSRGVEMLGYTREEWLEVPDRWIRSIHAEDRERVLHASESALATGVPLDDEYRMLARDGSVRWIHDRGSFVLDEDGKAVEWRGIMIDVTARKQAELQVLESEARYRRLIESSPDAILVHANGRILLANPAAAELFGAQSPDALRGAAIARLVHPDSRREGAERVKEVIASGKTSAPIELRWVTLDNRVVETEVTGAVVTVHGVLAVQVTARDIGPRRHAHDELARTLALLEATIESTTDGLLVVDLEGRIVRINRKFVELWRIPEHIVASRDDAQALAFVLDQLEDPDGFLRKVQEVYASPDAESYDTLRFKDGRVYERASKPQRLNGETVGRVWSFKDVTSRLELEAQVRQSQKMEAIGSLAGGVAHDFNNILTVIRGHVEMMLADERVSQEHRSDLTQVYGAAERAMTLTRQLLAFSRKQIMRPVVVDLGEIVRALEPMLRRLIGEYITIDHQVDAEAYVLADRAQVEQVLLNLVVNARDAMPKGGTVRLRVTNVELATERRMRRGATIPSGRYVFLAVQDTGVGIQLENLDRVFEPFFTTKEPGKGTGLGLATVYGIVKQSNGFVEVKSQVGSGTTIEVLFPAALDCPLSPHSSELPTVAQGSETILVVEDETAVRYFTQRALAQHGYTILPASSGEEALEIARKHAGRIDLVLTDVVMPGMGGARLVEELRQVGLNASVLFMSGYTDDDIIRSGLTQSAVRLLHKPFTIPELTTAVKKSLRSAAKR